MTEIEKAIEALTARLDKVAAENDDEFNYAVICFRRNGIVKYDFTAVETADSHEFVSGTGFTILEAVKQAEANLPAACKDWSYVLVG